MELLNKKVKTLEHKNLSDNYFNLEGTIINYREEEEIKRNSNGDPKPTGRIIEWYQVEFTQPLPHKEMSKSLWLFKDMFEIL